MLYQVVLVRKSSLIESIGDKRFISGY